MTELKVVRGARGLLAVDSLQGTHQINNLYCQYYEKHVLLQALAGQRYTCKYMFLPHFHFRI